MKIFAETERLILREILPDDEDALFALDADPEVHRYVGNKPVKNIEQVRQIITLIRNQYMEHNIGRWAVIEKASNDFIGWSGLKLYKDTVNNFSGFYELGYRLMKKHWGKGYASEAAMASLKYGFEVMKLDNIYAMTHHENAASKNVLAKAGLQYVESFDFDNEPNDWFHITKDDWHRRLTGI